MHHSGVSLVDTFNLTCLCVDEVIWGKVLIFFPLDGPGMGGCVRCRCVACALRFFLLCLKGKPVW